MRTKEGVATSRLCFVSCRRLVRMRRSQLQRDVLRLYRAVLRACDGKPTATRNNIRIMFRQQAASVKRSDVMRIEWLMRRGRRQLDYLHSADRVTRL